MKKSISYFLTLFIAIVWLVNGLFCKVLNFVPRHQEIVATILGNKVAPNLTMIIGLLEVAMFFWILTKIKAKICSTLQILIIGTMNVLEFFLAPDLLLFGKLNIVFAAMFMVLIFINEFYLRDRKYF
ncbi:DoxX-like family protein [Pedobacter frigiditerrae]|uniref:DoxX-like family protein n=1 Tax=Pedobacter frigiditerrae TaxID=2530452 RepID=UPI00292EF4A6|nr:DoxX-like family protein [Pedobacter frigiditerrae]